MYYNCDDDSVSDGAIEKMDILSGEELSYTYDGLSRLTQRSVAHALVTHSKECWTHSDVKKNV